MLALFFSGYTRDKRDTGVRKNGEDPYYYDDYQNANQIDDEDPRIVNGYNADKRPWLIHLRLNGGRCGGALINHKYV